jgi:glycosyltransferase involved in cell wall biosynthesis
MITYNHAPYFAHAVESALAQETSFDYEIVIGEDCSTDGTRELVAQYARDYPEKIRAFQAASNLGMRENFLRTWKACTGEYIAMLEGDDFWTSRTKLQRQVDFLDTTPECSLCFHKVTVVRQDGSILVGHDGSNIEYANNVKTLSGIEDILRKNFIATPSVMFRNGLIAELPVWATKIAMLDWLLWALHATRGQLGYIEGVMGSYRLHAGGAWSALHPALQTQNTAQFLRHMDSELGFRYHRQVSESICAQYNSLALWYWTRGLYAEARRCTLACFREVRFPVCLKENVQLLARTLLPSGFKIARSGWRLLTHRIAGR